MTTETYYYFDINLPISLLSEFDKIFQRHFISFSSSKNIQFLGLNWSIQDTTTREMEPGAWGRVLLPRFCSNFLTIHDRNHFLTFPKFVDFRLRQKPRTKLSFGNVWLSGTTLKNRKEPKAFSSASFPHKQTNFYIKSFMMVCSWPTRNVLMVE